MSKHGVNPITGKNMPIPYLSGKKPIGRPTSPLQDPGPRTKALLDKFGTKTILEAIDDRDKLDKFSAYDAMLIVGLANSLKGSGEERERMFNRMFGKVPDKQISLNVNIDVDSDQLTGKAQDMLANLIGDGEEDNSDLIEG